MNKVISFIRLDLYTIKPYRKSLYFYMALGLIMAIAFKSLSILSSFFMVSLVLIMVYPFTISEKNGMETLYSTLSLRRKNVVIGRYGFVLFIETISIIYMSVVAALLSTFFTIDFSMKETLLTLSMLSMVFSFIISLQYPFFFRFGYTKARTLANIPVFVIVLALGILPNLMEKSWIFQSWNTFSQVAEANPILLFVLPLASGMLALTVSCFIACRLYGKRDL